MLLKSTHKNGFPERWRFLNLARYPLDSPFPLIHWVWFLIMNNLQSKYQVSRSNYVGFSSILKKHQPMTCLTFFPILL